MFCRAQSINGVAVHTFFARPASLTARQVRAWRWSAALTLLRLALAPALVVLAWQQPAAWPLVAVLIVGLGSDILDGRVLGWCDVSAPGLRALDSAVDSVFYIAAAIAAWHRQPAVLAQYRWVVLSVVALEVLNNVVGLYRYGRTPAYHARSARIFGAFLFVSLALLLGGATRALLPFTLALGILAQLESLLISGLLSRWTTDVPSVRHAWRLRQRGG